MKLTNLPVEFAEAQPVLNALQEAGFEAYFVGGSVRDVLLGKKIHDVDIATSALPEEMKAIFLKTIDVGIQHGTILVLFHGGQYEVTTFRTESTYHDFRRPDHVTFVRSLEEDLKRRDFTINAFALDPSGDLIDLFDGLADLDQKIIRAVGDPQERFHEDALRMMRGLRFASQLDFAIEKETLAAIYDYHHLLGKISIERIQAEFTQLLMARHRRNGLLPFVETECYLYCPGLKNFGAELLETADLPALPFEKASHAWAVLIDQMGLADEKIGSFMKSWKLSNQLITDVRALLKGLTVRKNGGWTADSLYALGLAYAEEVENLLPFYHLSAEHPSLSALYDALPIKCREELAVNGKDLLENINVPQGPWIGAALQQAEQLVLHQRLPNDREKILQYLKEEKEIDF